MEKNVNERKNESVVPISWLVCADDARRGVLNVASDVEGYTETQQFLPSYIVCA